MGFEYAVYQLIILVGLLIAGIYVIITDELVQTRGNKSEKTVKPAENDIVPETINIQIPDVAYIYCDCTRSADDMTDGNKLESTDKRVVEFTEKRLR